MFSKQLVKFYTFGFIFLRERRIGKYKKMWRKGGKEGKGAGERMVGREEGEGGERIRRQTQIIFSVTSLWLLKIIFMRHGMPPVPRLSPITVICFPFDDKKPYSDETSFNGADAVIRDPEMNFFFFLFIRSLPRLYFLMDGEKLNRNGKEKSDWSKL